ncbi:hypothetical protein BDZ89DRAFT_1160050 [Hymenopellis radicata]|nr:hypothetical protein BDZ89DRAFT_1160050 [Hymenopellis radicata]
MAKKWYAVTAGRNIGVFDNWLVVAQHVIAVPESVFRGYKTHEQATDAFEEARVAGLLKTIPMSKRSSNQAMTTPANRESAVDRSPRGVRPPSTPLPNPAEGSATRPTGDPCTKASSASPPGTATLVEGSSPLRPRSSPGRASPSKSQQQPTPAKASPKVDAKSSARSASESFVTAVDGYSSDEEDMEIQVISHASSPSTPRFSARAKEKQREILPLSPEQPSPRPFETGGSISSPQERPKKSPSPKAQSTNFRARKKPFPRERPGVTRRVFLQTPPGLASYPDDTPPPNEPGKRPAMADENVLSPLSSPRLHTPAAMLSLDYASISSSPRKAPPSDTTSVSVMMSSLGLTSSVGRSPVISSYSPDRALDPRSPIAKSAALPRAARQAIKSGLILRTDLVV